MNKCLIAATLFGTATVIAFSSGCATLATNQALAKENQKLRKENAALTAQFDEEEEEEKPAAPAKAEKAAEKPSAKVKELEAEKAELAEQLERSEAEKAKLRKAIIETPAPEKKLVATPVASAPPAPPTAPPAPIPAMDPRLLLGGTVGPAAGYENGDPTNNIPCGGMCWGIRNKSQFFMAAYVDDREMTIHSGFRAKLAPASQALPGGGREDRMISTVRPRRLVNFVNNSVGNHTVTMVFYTFIPGVGLQPVGTAERTYEFPRLQGGEWGLEMDITGPDQRIAMY